MSSESSASTSYPALYKPPYPPATASNQNSFAFETQAKRWPKILAGIVDGISKINFKLDLPNSLNPEIEREVLREGKELIADIGKIRHEIGRDREMQPIPDDNEPLINLYNQILEREYISKGRETWFQGDWLFNECYLYRILRSFFAKTKYWKDYDPFAQQKLSTFHSSSTSVHQLSSNLERLIAEHEEEGIKNPKNFESKKNEEDESVKQHLAFLEMAQMCLWGNATDLSLLTNLTHSDIQALQRTGKTAQKENESFILSNDLDLVWNHLKNLDNKSGGGGVGEKTKKRIDFVWDNSGFELFTDLVFADWLVTISGFCDEVVFHPKLIPWFVSDVLPHDLKDLLSSLSSPTFFTSPFPDSPSLPPFLEQSNQKWEENEDQDGQQRRQQRYEPKESEKRDLENMVKRWKGYLDEGKWRFCEGVGMETKIGENVGEVADFWTNPLPYSEIPTFAPKLLEELKKSDLAIFKGDLHYRKLTQDADYPSETSFRDALGPLAGRFPILTLRTCKADVCVGLEKGVAEELDQKDKNWRSSGKYAVVSFCDMDTE